ncbi:hypothetical protein BC629DRAFT_943225 [Irpex lacteus]|nr:hypothetical protein BC629DRAFT_943225 [Irpex lacteus]
MGSNGTTDVVQLQQAMSYVQVICITLLVYDWILVVSDEVRHLWTERWTFVKVLYLWTRYSPVVDTFWRIWGHFIFLSPQECKVHDAISTFLIAIGIHTSELVLVWRTLALWRDSKWIRYSLWAAWVLMLPIGTYSTTTFVMSTNFAALPYPNVLGCNLAHASMMTAAFISLAVLELVIVILTLAKGMYHSIP